MKIGQQRRFRHGIFEDSSCMKMYDIAKNRDVLLEFKSLCLVSFESLRSDKVHIIFGYYW